ncbi:MAG: hypothetical protein RL654_2461 [Pseudomonadota bacterium]|jgi:dihydroneopterin aldolase
MSTSPFATTINRIVLQRLAMPARIGVHDWETAAPQPITVDLEFDLPDERASLSDLLADTINYAEVVDRLRTLAMAQPHQLVEALARSMCDLLLQDFGLTRVRLTLMKLAPFPGAEVGIVMERCRASRLPAP